MRFGMVHRVMTDALAALGVIALVASGQFNHWVSGGILVGLAIAVLFRESWLRHPALKHLDTAALLAVLAVQITRVAMGASVLDVLVEFAAALQIIRLATRRGAAHDQQVIVLALLHLIAGTVLGGGLGYGLCFFGVLVVAPGALVLSHLRREVEGNYRQGARDRTGLPVDVPRILRSRRVVGRSFLAVTCLLSIPIFVFTAALFVVFPRVGLSLLLLNRGHTGRMIGFSDHVDLGEVGVLRSDPTIALRLEIPSEKDVANPPARRAFHLRGTALDAYDGRSWRQSVPYRQSAATLDGSEYGVERRLFSDAGTKYHIELEPIDPPVVFLPEGAIALKLRSRGLDPSAPLFEGAEGELKYQPLDDRGLKYDVYLSPKNEASFRELSPGARSRYLETPPDMPARVRDLAERWAKGADGALAKAKAIEQHLRTEYRYDLGSPSGGKAQPLDDFLFESKRGHCEYYSTAMAILLRYVDVPTRNVTGFIGGTWNRFGRFYAVRQGDAHSWVEVWIDGRGWVTFDPTPPADAAPKTELGGFWAVVRDFLEATSQRWDRHVVGYDLGQQMSLFAWLKSKTQGGRGADHHALSPRKLAAPLAVLTVAVGIAAYVAWRRRRRPTEAEAKKAERSRSAVTATALYEQLESAMMGHGIARAPGTPPLRHAEALRGSAHPLGGEIVDLTRIYLDARFGGRVITDEEKRVFERRIRAIAKADLRARAEEQRV